MNKQNTPRRRLTTNPRPGVLPLGLVAAAASLLVVGMSVASQATPEKLDLLPVSAEVVVAQGAQATDDPSELNDSDADSIGTDSPFSLATVEVSLSRDPFEEVVPELEAAVDPSDPNAPVDPSDPADPSDPVDPGVVPPGMTAGCNGTDEIVCDGRLLTVVGLQETEGQSLARIRVGPTMYTVAEGDVFAEDFRFVGVQGECAQLVYGADQPLTLCAVGTPLK